MRIVAALLLCLLACSTHAADDGAHRQSAYSLAQVAMRFQDEDGKSLACVSDRATFGVELKRDYPTRASSFGGISPQSIYWPEIEEINYQYRLATCPISKTLVQGFADLLARELTTADLDAAVVFYSSPVGQRMLAGMAKSGKEFSALSRIPSPQQDAADVAYRTGLRELMAKYKSDPR